MPDKNKNMTGASLTLGIWESHQLQSVNIENVNLESKVELIKNEAAKKFNTQDKQFGEKMTCNFIEVISMFLFQN